MLRSCLPFVQLTYNYVRFKCVQALLDIIDQETQESTFKKKQSKQDLCTEFITCLHGFFFLHFKIVMYFWSDLNPFSNV